MKPDDLLTPADFPALYFMRQTAQLRVDLADALAALESMLKMPERDGTQLNAIRRLDIKHAARRTLHRLREI